MRVKFIAHAGFHIEHAGSSVMVDPWFYSSTFEHPVIRGLVPQSQTIDFQIPSCRDRPEDFRPDAIFVSHFHAHHNPVRDILTLLAQREQTLLGFPGGDEDLRPAIAASLGESTRRAVLRPLAGDETVEIGQMIITARRHPAIGHLGYQIKCPGGCVLHLADPIINRDLHSRRLDPLWERFRDLRPDLLFISVGGNCTKMNGAQVRERYIQEHSIVSPVEAARIAANIKPRLAAAIGIYNHSIWRNRHEFALPAAVAEEGFRWAMDFLAPAVVTVPLRPGFLFEVADGKIAWTPGETIRF